MDRDVVLQKLEAIRRCLRRIEDKCPHSAAEIAQDADAQDIVALNLTRAVQLCVDIGAHLVADSEAPPPHTTGETFDLLAELGHISPQLALRMK